MKCRMNTNNPLKLLCIADLHHYTQSELDKIKDLQYDICFLLGDISQEALNEIRCIVGDKPLYGVHGNHDTVHQLEECGIEHLNNNFITVDGYRIVGFSGSHRYKDGDCYEMLTQKQSMERCNSFIERWSYGWQKLQCDILISHDSMYKLFGKKDSAHIGLMGITKLIKKSKIKLNICGHYHQQKQLKRRGCGIICVYRCAVISLPELTVENIF